MNTPKLLPCPFCGGSARIALGEHDFNGAQIECMECFASGGHHSDDNRGEAAADAWNSRAAIEAQGVPDVGSLTDAIAEGLSGTYHCTRVWEAWHVGTMGQEDFEPVDESDTPRELAETVIAMLASAPPAPQASEKPLFGELIAQHPGLAQELQASVVQQEPVAIVDRVAGSGPNDVCIQWRCGIACIGTKLYTHPAQQVKPHPLSDPLRDDIQSVLFEVEQAIGNGSCPWQIQAAFEAYEAARRLQQPAHGIKE